MYCGNLIETLLRTVENAEHDARFGNRDRAADRSVCATIAGRKEVDADRTSRSCAGNGPHVQRRIESD